MSSCTDEAGLPVFSICSLFPSVVGFLIQFKSYSSIKATLQTSLCKCNYSYISALGSNSNKKLSCCCLDSPKNDRKCQINKHLLVFRLICSLLFPVFSHDALHPVPGVSMSCVAWRGFLNPPGLQLTPLLIDVCPFSISIATPTVKCFCCSRNKSPQQEGNVSVSFQSAQSSLLIRCDRQSNRRMEVLLLTDRQWISLEIQENTQKKDKERNSSAFQAAASCHGFPFSNNPSKYCCVVSWNLMVEVRSYFGLHEVLFSI